MRRLFFGLLLASGVVVTALFFLWIAGFPSLLEPDRLYHLAFVREAARQQTWIPHSWWQFPLLHWQNFFADKEFLFHLLLQMAYRISGENAVLPLGLTFSAMLVWLPLLLFPKDRWFALGLSIVLIPLHPFLLFRCSLLRPHTLAMLLFTAFLYLFLAKRYRLSSFMLVLYSLAYHAFYVPVFLCCLAMVAEGIKLSLGERGHEKHSWFRIVPWLIAASTAGIVLHPNFPGNLVQSFQGLAISFHAVDLSRSLHLTFGGEIFPPEPLPFFLSWYGLVTALLWAGATLLYRWKRTRRLEREEIWLGLVALCLLIGSIKNLRLLEYGVPVWIAFLATVFCRSRKSLKWALVLGLFATQALPLFRLVNEARHSGFDQSPSVNAMRELLLPIAGKKTRVFHDNWALGPYIVYLLPDAEAIDALDPTFLLLANPGLTGLRTALVEGRVPRPVEAIRQAFGATYALCEPSALQRQLLASPNAKVLRSTADRRFILFEL